MEKTYVLLGDPIPLMRARHGQKRTWDAQKQLKLISGLELRRQHEEYPLFSGCLHMDITFYMSIPKTSLKRASLLKFTPHYYRPDLSNLIKYVEDVASGILYVDDCLISSISAKKVYDEVVRTEFTLRELLKSASGKQ